MIQDTVVLEEINDNWKAVEEMLDISRYSWTETEVAPGIIDFTRTLAEMTANLCVVFALGVLERTLLQLRDEGVFPSKGCALKSLMFASSEAGLSWLDFGWIDDIRRCRNNIAHKPQSFPEDECLIMINAIKAELQAWSILKGPEERVDRRA